MHAAERKVATPSESGELAAERSDTVRFMECIRKESYPQGRIQCVAIVSEFV